MSDEVCPICLFELEIYATVITDCNHVFHHDCMLQAINTNKSFHLVIKLTKSVLFLKSLFCSKHISNLEETILINQTTSHNS